MRPSNKMSQILIMNNKFQGFYMIWPFLICFLAIFWSLKALLVQICISTYGIGVSKIAIIFFISKLRSMVTKPMFPYHLCLLWFITKIFWRLSEEHLCVSPWNILNGWSIFLKNSYLKCYIKPDFDTFLK